MGLTKNQLIMRRSGISASDVAAVLGLNPYRRPIDVWYDKTRSDPVEEQEETEQQALGNAFEEYISDYYAKTLVPKGIKRRLYRPRKTIMHPEHHWVFATPDRFVFEGDDLSDLPRGLRDLSLGGSASHLAEIKLVGPYAIKNWITEEGAEAEDSDQIPSYVFCQCQWQMFVTGYKRVDVVAMLGGTKIKPFGISYDVEFVDYAFRICDDFRQRYILRNVEPPPDGSSSYKNYLDKRFPGQIGGALVEAPECAEHIATQYTQCIADIKELTQKKETFGQQLKDLIGDNDGIQGSWGKVTWRLGKGRISYKSALEELGPKDEALKILLDKHRTPARAFRVAVKK